MASVSKKRANGEGSIYKKADGTWAASISIGRNDEGKIKRKVFYGKSRREVKEKLDNYNQQYGLIGRSDISDNTFADLIRTWLYDTKRNELKPTSFDRLEQVIESYIVPSIGFYQCHNIDSDVIQKLINSLRDKGYSVSTIKKVYNAINAFYKQAIAQRKLTYNPVQGVTMPHNQSKPEVRMFLQEEIKAITEASTALYGNGERIYRLGSVFPLLCNTGLRAGEMCALKWDAVDLEERLLTVRANRVITKDRSSDAPTRVFIDQDSTKTVSGMRKIPLNDNALKALMDLKTITGDYDYVIATKEGNPCSTYFLDHSFRRVLEDAGLKDTKNFGVHSLRHTFATTLLRNGVDIKVVSTLLGHSDINVTYNTYIHIIREQQEAAVKSIPNI